MAVATKLSETTHTIQVDRPLKTVYNQWTQFEEFPRFMEGVQSVKQLDDDRLHWTLDIGGRVIEYEAEITDQVPDKRIAWTSRKGRQTGGRVTFQKIDDGATEVTLTLQYDPQGPFEAVADLVGLISGRARGDLERFKAWMESREDETGAWRGKIEKD